MAEPVRIRNLLHQAIKVYLRPYWVLHIPLAMAVVLAVVMEVCVPLTIKSIIDGALLPHDWNNLKKNIFVLVGVIASAMIARFMMHVISAYMHKELVADLRVEFIKLIRCLPMSYLEGPQVGLLSAAFDVELITLARMLRDLFSRGFYAALQFGMVLFTLLFLSWQLALIVIFTLPMMVLLILRVAQSVTDANEISRKSDEIFNAQVDDYVASQALGRAFGREEPDARRAVDKVPGRKGERYRLRGLADLQRTFGTHHFKRQMMTVSMDQFRAGSTLLVAVAGAYLTFVGALTLGSFSVFLLLLPIVMRTITSLAGYSEDLGRASLSLAHLQRLKDATTPEVDQDGKIDLPVPSQAIRFEGVSFGYNDTATVLDDVNLTLPVHQSVAIVGRSGSGKSTLFKLLLGFYHPTAGRISVDDHDLRRLASGALGSRIGAVLQTSILINGTVRENICYAKPDATSNEMYDAAKMAEIHEFIISLPQGYETAVGERGRRLSEGQRQRLALARAILPNPPILLFDEVTASLDPATEMAINATIEKLSKDRTVILVTHRLAAVAFVDRLVIIDQGKIEEQGNHAALLAQQGLYAHLWRMQTGFVVSNDRHRAEVSGDRLRAIPLFQDVDLTKLNELALRFTSGYYDTSDLLCEEGEAGDKFFIIVRGSVAISTLGAGGHPIRLADLQDGDYFGEVEMLNRGRRTTTVRAKTPCLVLTLSAAHFHAMLDEISSLNKIVTQMALDRSLSTICSIGRRPRNHAVWRQLMPMVVPHPSTP